MKKTDTKQFGALRFAAALFMFIWHATQRGFACLPFSWEIRWNATNSAVVFFFMLSGMMSALYVDTDGRDLSAEKIGRYMLAKIRRLYPVYLAVTLFSISFTQIPHMISERDFAGLKYPLALLARHLLLLQSWVRIKPDDLFAFSQVGWFVSTIMFLYLLNHPIHFAAGRIDAVCERRGLDGKRRAIVHAGIAVAAAAVSALYCLILGGTDTEFTEYVFPIARIGEYVCGIALGYAIRYGISAGEEQKTSVGRSIMYTVAELASLAMWTAWLFIPLSSEDWRFRIVRWIIPNVILLVVFAAGRGYISRLFGLKPFVYLGSVSYEFYLIHSMVIMSYLVNTGEGIVSTGNGSLISTAFCVVMTILISGLVSGVTRKKAKAGGSRNK